MCVPPFSAVAILVPLTIWELPVSFVYRFGPGWSIEYHAGAPRKQVNPKSLQSQNMFVGTCGYAIDFF